MLTGSDVRRYRKLLGLNQTDFARQLGLTQSTLSLIEGGRTGLSEDHLARLSDQFKAPDFQPPFAEYQSELAKELSSGLGALSPSTGEYRTLKVWQWDESFDLGRPPRPEQAVDLVTTQATDRPAIAFKMPTQTEWWAAGEMFVFETCARDEVEDGDLCAVQLQASNSTATNTVIAVAHVAPAKRGREVQFRPVSPAGPVFTATDENILALLAASYRGRCLK